MYEQTPMERSFARAMLRQLRQPAPTRRPSRTFTTTPRARSEGATCRPILKMTCTGRSVHCSELSTQLPCSIHLPSASARAPSTGISTSLILRFYGCAKHATRVFTLRKHMCISLALQPRKIALILQSVARSGGRATPRKYRSSLARLLARRFLGDWNIRCVRLVALHPLLLDHISPIMHGTHAPNQLLW